MLLGVSAGTKYLLCDETFDGLDPVMRQGVKSLFASEIMGREFTPVIASHNLRELEDICDHVGLLYKGGILLSRDLEDMKFHIPVCSERQRSGTSASERNGCIKDGASGFSAASDCTGNPGADHGENTGEKSPFL